MARLGRAQPFRPQVQVFPSSLPFGTIFDAASSSAYEAALSTYSWSHAVAAQSNRILVVAVSIFAAGSVTSITYNGVALTQNASATVTNGVYRTEIWYLVSPATGTNTVQVNLSTSLTSIANAVSYYHVDQSAPIEATATNTGTGNPASVGVTTVRQSSMMFGNLTTPTATTTDAAGQNRRAENSGALGSSDASDKGPVNPAGSTTLTWTGVGVADAWCAAAVSIRPSITNIYLQALSGALSFIGSITKRTIRALSGVLIFEPVFATWNSADKGSNVTLSGGNLVATKSTATWTGSGVRSTISKSTGKWYWELIMTTDVSLHAVMSSVANGSATLDSYFGVDTNSWSYYGNDGQKWFSNVGAAFGSTYTQGDVISIALDAGAGKVWWAKNGTWQASGDPSTDANPAFTGLSGSLYAGISMFDNTDKVTANFGATPMTYTTPTGYNTGLYNNSVVSVAASLVKQTSRALSGVLSFVGSVVKRTSRALAGTLSFVGSVAKRIGKVLSGALSFVGSVAKSTSRSITGALSFVGSCLKSTSTARTATLSFVGAVTKRTSRALTGALSFVGSCARSASRALSATLSFVGAMAKQTNRSLSGAVALAGSCLKSTSRAASAALSFVGAVSKQTNKALSSAFAMFVSQLNEMVEVLLSGATTFAGSCAKSTSRATSAALGLAGSVAKRVGKALTATLDLAGSVAKRIPKALSGALDFAGSVAKRMSQALSASLDYFVETFYMLHEHAGHAANTTYEKVLDSTLTMTGHVVGMFATARFLVGSLWRVAFRGTKFIAARAKASVWRL